MLRNYSQNKQRKKHRQYERARLHLHAPPALVAHSDRNSDGIPICSEIPKISIGTSFRSDIGNVCLYVLNHRNRQRNSACVELVHIRCVSSPTVLGDL